MMAAEAAGGEWRCEERRRPAQREQAARAAPRRATRVKARRPCLSAKTEGRADDTVQEEWGREMGIADC